MASPTSPLNTEDSSLKNEVNSTREQMAQPKSSPSIVADVLSRKELTKSDSLNKAMKGLSQKTDVLKSQIYGEIFKQYTEFYHAFNFGEELNKKLGKLVKEMNKLGDDIQDNTLSRMETAEDDLIELTKEYNKNQGIIEALRKLCKIHESIQACANGLYYKDYLKAAKAVKDMRGYLNNLSSGTCEAQIFKAVRDEYRTKKALLRSKLEASWSELLEWNTATTASWDSVEGHLKTSLKVYNLTVDLKSSAHGVTSLTSLYKAMDCLEIFDARLNVFAKKMMNFLLKPLVIFPGIKPVIERDKVFHLRFAKEDKKAKSRRPDPGTVYQKVADVIRFVACHVFPSTPGDKSKETAEDDSKADNVLRNGPCAKLQSLIWPELSELIINECLSSSVPTNHSQLKKYDMIIKITYDFEEELHKLGFLDADANTLSTYAKDINVHFANKKCQDLLVEARDLMTSVIHGMVKVEPDNDRARLIIELQDDKNFSKETKLMLSGLKQIPGSFLSTKMFLFPECRISESTQKLMNLAYETLLEAASSTPEVAIQLFYSARNMFELFCDVVPTYHKDNLGLPQMAALHYNNSMYLAHHCLTLGHQFKHSLPLTQGIVTFVDLVPVLRKSGEKCFLEQLRKQKLQLQEILQYCNDFTEFDNEENVFAAQKAFEQILDLLVKLSRVWRGVLPKNIYDKSLGSLFNTVLDDIAAMIIKLEDISAEEATQFHWVLKILINRAGEIFNLKSNDENTPQDMGFIVHLHSWQKFNEIVSMMDSSLQGIVDRWADGKGPLAQCFDAWEVKCLIKALFQNTNRRAQALAKIKLT
eukprot:gene17000-18713_t